MKPVYTSIPTLWPTPILNDLVIKLGKAGLFLERDLVYDMAQEISDSIDREILTDLLSVARTPT